MAIYRDALGNVIATNGEGQPASFRRVTPAANSTPATLFAGSQPVTTDYKYNDPTTGNLIADRS